MYNSCYMAWFKELLLHNKHLHSPKYDQLCFTVKLRATKMCVQFEEMIHSHLPGKTAPKVAPSTTASPPGKIFTLHPGVSRTQRKCKNSEICESQLSNSFNEALTSRSEIPVNGLQVYEKYRNFCQQQTINHELERLG